MSHIIFASPHMVVTGTLHRSSSNHSEGVVDLDIVLQINGKVSTLNYTGHFHEGCPTQEAYKEWVGLHGTLRDLGYIFAERLIEEKPANDLLDEFYNYIEEHEQNMEETFDLV